MKGLDMKTHFISAFIALLCTAHTASAATYHFEQGYSEGARLFGSFEAEDLDGDNILGSHFSEITAFTGRFSGNSFVAAFDVPNLLDLVVDLRSSPILGDAAPTVEERLSASSPTSDASVLVAHLPFLPGCGALAACGIVTFNGGYDQSTTDFVISDQAKDASIAPVPLPATGLLLSTLMAAGLAFARRKH